MNRLATAFLLAMGIGSGGDYVQMPEQYPAPLPHTSTNHPAERVLVISINGLRAINLANFVSSHPQSALAELTRRGVTYSNAHVTWPDTAAGIMAFASGGSPISTGIFSSEGYDRSLLRPGKECGPIASALNLVDGRVELSKAENGCEAQQVHRLVLVNNVFEIVHAAGGRTAWADTNAAYADLLRGPSGKALDDVFIATAAPTEKSAVIAAEERDRQCVAAVTQWMAGGPNVPRLSGLSLLGLDAAQRSVPLSQTATQGAASKVKRSPLEHIDAQVGNILAVLKKERLFDSTWIIVTGPHGSMGDVANIRVIDSSRVERVAQLTAGSELGHIATGTVAMVWLKHLAKTDSVVNAYRAQMTELGIGAIYFGEKLRLIMNTAQEDSRMPDLILEPQAGVVWSRDGQWPEHLGGFSDDENHIAMLVSGKQIVARLDKTSVSTGQVAPLILEMLGMEKYKLDGLRREHVPALPGLF